jgi:hypothetical protein
LEPTDVDVERVEAPRVALRRLQDLHVEQGLDDGALVRDGEALPFLFGIGPTSFATSGFGTLARALASAASICGCSFASIAASAEAESSPSTALSTNVASRFFRASALGERLGDVVVALLGEQRYGIGLAQPLDDGVLDQASRTTNVSPQSCATRLDVQPTEALNHDTC